MTDPGVITVLSVFVLVLIGKVFGEWYEKREWRRFLDKDKERRMNDNP